MAYKQVNLSLSDGLRASAQSYANAYGYKNIQELAAEALREKIYSDLVLTKEELESIKKAEKERSMSKEEFLEKTKDIV
jgi:hypothetical protein